jgi:hypothetical protein
MRHVHVPYKLRNFDVCEAIPKIVHGEHLAIAVFKWAATQSVRAISVACVVNPPEARKKRILVFCQRTMRTPSDARKSNTRDADAFYVACVPTIFTEFLE